MWFCHYFGLVLSSWPSCGVCIVCLFVCLLGCCLVLFVMLGVCFCVSLIRLVLMLLLLLYALFYNLNDLITFLCFIKASQLTSFALMGHASIQFSVLLNPIVCICILCLYGNKCWSIWCDNKVKFLIVIIYFVPFFLQYAHQGLCQSLDCQLNKVQHTFPTTRQINLWMEAATHDSTLKIIHVPKQVWTPCNDVTRGLQYAYHCLPSCWVKSVC